MSTGGLGDLFSEEEKKVRRVTLASASHLLPPTMSDSEIGGEPAISTSKFLLFYFSYPDGGVGEGVPSCSLRLSECCHGLHSTVLVEQSRRNWVGGRTGINCQ